MGNGMLDEIRKGVQLKKIEKKECQQEKKPVGKITKDETNFLKNSLAEAIKQRRMELTRNDVESDKSDDDWSD
jgi:hypothetical protein